MLESLKPDWGLGDFLSGPPALRLLDWVFLREVGEDAAKLPLFKGELLVTAYRGDEK